MQGGKGKCQLDVELKQPMGAFGGMVREAN